MSDQPNEASGSRKAAWTLIVLAPLSAELTFSGVTMPIMWLLLPLLVPAYGAGVLLLRELVVRFRGGWPSLLVAGLIYELAEDGIGLQALTSPNLYHAAEWGPRVLGFNTTYWESQIGYHTVFSVLIPVLLTQLMFPRHSDRPYLKRGGLVLTAVVAVLGVGILRLVIATTQDPGYVVPLPTVLGLVAAILVLGFVALRVLPRRTPAAPRVVGPAPRPVVVGLGAAAAAFAFMGLLMPVGMPPDQPAWGSGAWVVVPMALAAGIAVLAIWQVRRWWAADNWSDAYSLWLVGGALLGRTFFAVATAPTANDYALAPSALAMAVGTGFMLAMAYALVRLNRHLARRDAHQDESRYRV